MDLTQFKSELQDIRSDYKIKSTSGLTPEQLYNYMTSRKDLLFWHDSSNLAAKIWVVTTVTRRVVTRVSSLPIEFRDASGNRIENNRMWSKLRESPNGYETWENFVESIATHKFINGNAYIYSEFLGSGNNERFGDVVWLFPNWMIPDTTTESFITPVNKYQYSEGANARDFLPSEIGHIFTSTGGNRIIGESVISSSPRLLENYAMSEQMMNTNLKNSGTTGHIVSLNPVDLLDEQKRQFQERLKEEFGPENSGKVKIVGGLEKIVAMGATAADMKLIESNRISAADIASAMGYPLELLGNLSEQKNYSNYESAKEEVITSLVLPLAKSIFSGLSRYLFKNRYKIVILENSIPELQPKLSDLEGVSFMTDNEKRAEKGLAAYDNENADKLIKNIGSTLIDNIGVLDNSVM